MRGKFVKAFVVFVTGVFFFCAAALGGQLRVTKVIVSPGAGTEFQTGTAVMTFNGVLTVRDIKVLRVAGRTGLKFPEYVSGKGRMYSQVKLLTPQANEAARQAAETGKPSPEAAQAPVTFSIARISKYNKQSKLKAFVEVRFADALEVECKVLEGRGGLWVGWPETRGKDGRWRGCFYVEDGGLKGDVEREILAQYNK